MELPGLVELPGLPGTFEDVLRVGSEPGEPGALDSALPPQASATHATSPRVLNARVKEPAEAAAMPHCSSASDRRRFICSTRMNHPGKYNP